MAAQELPPVVFEPILKEKIWGGDNLSRTLRKNLPANTRIGESWEISGYGEDLSTASSAPVEGMVMDDLLRIYGEEILGPSEDYNYFPLLFKFIDAQDKLSVQVHPDDRRARDRGWGKFGKSECWFVVDAKPNAHIIAGFKPGVTIDDVKHAIETRQLEALLNNTPICPGDVIYVPAGTVHAIMEGTLIYEVQETSDTTFRLYDWDRVDADGNRRQLHIEESLDVMDTTCRENCKIQPIECSDISPGSHSFRAVCKYFAIEEYRLGQQQQIRLPHKKSFQVITLLAGAATIRTEFGSRHLQTGQTVLVPAGSNNVRIHTSTDTQALVSTIPDIRREVIEPLRDMGLSDKQIAQLGGYQSRNDILRHMS
ncbi:MAG: type I phosphomannose isomerase catalytic subunit [Chitinivibrionales bacterium]